MIIFFCVVAGVLPIAAQEDLSPATLTEAQLANLSDEMTSYINEVNEVTSSVSTANAAQFPAMLRHLQSIDVRWKAYTDLQQIAIAESPILMDILSQYKVIYMAAEDSINHQKARVEAAATFSRSLSFVCQCKAKYKHLSSLVLQYSLLPQTAERLDAVKAQEAILFGQVTENYQKGLAAVAASPALAQQQPTLENRYAEIKAMSEKIQAAAYKPWIERVKDYVMTFAGFAILLIFFNFAIAKIKALKDAREMAKKYGDMLNKNEQYPTI